MIIQSQRDGLVLFIMILLGISAATYHGKNTERAIWGERLEGLKFFICESQSHIVIKSHHLEVFFEANEACITNICAIEEGQPL